MALTTEQLVYFIDRKKRKPNKQEIALIIETFPYIKNHEIPLHYICSYRVCDLFDDTIIEKILRNRKQYNYENQRIVINLINLIFAYKGNILEIHLPINESNRQLHEFIINNRFCGKYIKWPDLIKASFKGYICARSADLELYLEHMHHLVTLPNYRKILHEMTDGLPWGQEYIEKLKQY